MKKFYFLLVGFFLFSGVNGQIINFPDANFKAKLLEADSSNTIAMDFSYNYFKIDANNNGEIEVSEALNVMGLNVSNGSSSASVKISNLSGLFNFTNLQSLSCFENLLTSLDLTLLTNLVGLNCDGNQITNLNINHLLNLKNISCQRNQLTNLVVSNLTQLEYLYCNENQIENLDLSNLNNLIYLTANDNQIQSIRLEGATQITTLQCQNNKITTLDISNQKYMSLVLCRYNPFLKSIFMKNGANELISLDDDLPSLQYICADDSQIDQIQNNIINYGHNNCTVNSYCSFSPGGEFYTIQGNNKWDFNNNGCDINDIPYSNMKFNITDGTNTGNLIADTTGNYNVGVVAGIHTITPLFENSSYFIISPTSVTVDFPTQASPFTQDFCVIANGVHPDLEIILIPTSVARPGFDATYKIIYKNKGNQTQSGSVNLAFDDAVLDFVSANPLTTSQAVNSLSWNFTNLLPFETREITLTLNVNAPTDTPAVNNGDELDYTATITSPATDDTPNDNTSVFHQTVVNAHDPNDKTCLEGTTITPAMVGEYVHYVIRFENTGTFPAQNIVVKDMIDTAKFDISTLIPIKGSHNFVTNITEGNKVEFIFENINLPFDDANNDGFVAFKIKTKSSLVVGDTFSNSANIYFDYNFPIVTNTATTTVQTLGTSDFEFAKYFTVYPSPAKSVLNLSVKSGIVVSSISIYNTLGQVVIAIPNAQSVSNIDVSSLKTGNYFIKMTTDKGTSNTKFIKE